MSSAKMWQCIFSTLKHMPLRSFLYVFLNACQSSDRFTVILKYKIIFYTIIYKNLVVDHISKDGSAYTLF
jgi:hypothetical protein